jgi:hypothetical protein
MLRIFSVDNLITSQIPDNDFDVTICKTRKNKLLTKEIEAIR